MAFALPPSSILPVRRLHAARPTRPVIVLGLETSCDETGVALLDSERGVLAHALHSQVDMHRDYGGVVPELASRDHIRKLAPMIRQSLRDSKLSKHDIDGIIQLLNSSLSGHSRSLMSSNNHGPESVQNVNGWSLPFVIFR